MTLLKLKDLVDDLLEEKMKTNVTMLTMIRAVQNHKRFTSAIWCTGQFSCCPTQYSICMFLLTKRSKKKLILCSQRTQCLYYSTNNESTRRGHAVCKLNLWNQTTQNELRHTKYGNNKQSDFQATYIASCALLSVTRMNSCQHTEETNIGNSKQAEKPECKSYNF